MKRILLTIATVTTLGAVGGTTVIATKPAAPAMTQQQRIERGRYLVTAIGCNDCHTPLKMTPKGPEPDLTRFLSGHPEQMKVGAAPKLGAGPWLWAGAATNTAFAGPWGISYAANLTPDKITGLGIWNEEMFVKTIRTGRHWGVARPILPPMPWQNFRNFSDDDLGSIYAFLRTIKPIHNQVPDAELVPAPPHRG
ncbi:MAG TPA: diheme cytochrome c-553 [Thermoanaerobaculia bacterium]|nr:diheme cytochrome c-553 [Thermoanaerobaculia bacterium]